MHPGLALLAIGTAAIALKKVAGLFSRPPRIFISYYYKDDKSLKRLLKAWNKNKRFDLEFEDTSADISLDTSSDDELKQQLTKCIKKSDVVLVLVGAKTHSRKWVKYEIQEAVRLSVPIVAVKKIKGYSSPNELKSVDAKWVYGFKARKVTDAIKSTT